MEKKLKALLKFLKINESTISTLLGGAIVVVVGILVYNYFTSLNQPGQVSEEAIVEVTPGSPVIVEEDGKQVPQGLPITYIVEKGDNLWVIAENFYNSGYNWVDVAVENNLTNPGYLEVGQKLTIPKVEVKQATVIADQKPATIEADSYTTQKGDYLWEIAVRAYGDGFAWTTIYQANLELIGTNPSLIEANMQLVIPRE